jgi:hypothetical protein
MNGTGDLTSIRSVPPRFPPKDSPPQVEKEMSIKNFLSTQLNSRLPKRTKNSGRLVVVYWDREFLHYLVVSFKPGLMKLVRSEAIAHSDFESPLAALADRLRGEGIVVQRLVVLLSRSDVEVLTMDLPAAADSEMPMLVSSAIEQQVGESDAPPIVDFYRVHRPGTLQPTSDLQSILAYLLSAFPSDSCRRCLYSRRGSIITTWRWWWPSSCTPVKPSWPYASRTIPC